MPDFVADMRPRLMSIAYRMLGSVADAEDAVQDAFLKLQLATDVISPEGFLVTATTRRCIDLLRMRRRDEYIGPWVPEPVETRGKQIALSESLTQAFLLMLERLSAEERAAFLLRVIFDYEYADIGRMLEKSEENVRQLVSRSRRRIGLEQHRFAADALQAANLAERFVAACRAGDLQAVESLFTEDVEVRSDGGGKVSAARVVITGRNRAARFLIGVFHKQRHLEFRPTEVNGAPGLVFLQDGKVVEVLAMAIEDGVKAVYVTVNPDKLHRWSLSTVE